NPKKRGCPARRGRRILRRGSLTWRSALSTGSGRQRRTSGTRATRGTTATTTGRLSPRTRPPRGRSRRGARPSAELVDRAKELEKHYIPTQCPNGFERGGSRRLLH